MTNILLVEDNPIDARLIQRVFQEMNDWPTRITWVDDGEKALRFLRSLEEFVDTAEPPGVILLDVNLPKYDGFQVLEAVRKSHLLQHMPVFMLSSSPVESIVSTAEKLQLRADGFFEKMLGLQGFEQIVTSVRRSLRPPVALFETQGFPTGCAAAS